MSIFRIFGSSTRVPSLLVAFSPFVLCFPRKLAVGCFVQTVWSLISLDKFEVRDRTSWSIVRLTLYFTKYVRSIYGSRKVFTKCEQCLYRRIWKILMICDEILSIVRQKVNEPIFERRVVRRMYLGGMYQWGTIGVVIWKSVQNSWFVILETSDRIKLLERISYACKLSRSSKRNWNSVRSKKKERNCI